MSNHKPFSLACLHFDSLDAVHLPYEIWAEIASHLRQSTSLWPYRRLNSAFYNAALDEKYESISPSLTCLEKGKNWREFFGFRGESLARRVRTVKYFYDNPTQGKISLILHSLFHVNRKPRDPFGPPALERLLKTIDALVNVSTLAISSLKNELPQHSILIFNMTLRACSSSLVSLNLSIPPAQVANVLEPNFKTFFPRLTSLSIGDSKTAWAFDPPPATQSPGMILTFVNRHRLTLTSLGLLTKVDTDGLSVFPELARFKNLKEFSFFLSASSDRRSIVKFLKEHAKTLQKLQIYAENCDFRALNGIFQNVNFPFPDLRHIQIANEALPLFEDSYRQHAELKETAHFIHRCSSLVTLDMHRMYMITDTFFHVFGNQQFTENFFEANLRKLDLRLELFTTDMLDILASRFPDLETLSIIVDEIKVRHNTLADQENGLSQFCKVIRQRNYSQWKLKDLTFFHLKGDASEAAAVAIATAVTSLDTINTAPRKDFLLMDYIYRNMP